MIGASGADTITFSLVGFVVVLALIVVWRLVVRDPRIRKVRFGVFYEREREDELEDVAPPRPPPSYNHENEADKP